MEFGHAKFIIMITFDALKRIKFVEICSVGRTDTSIMILNRVVRAGFDHLRLIFGSLIISHAGTCPSCLIFWGKLLAY